MGLLDIIFGKECCSGIEIAQDKNWMSREAKKRCPRPARERAIIKDAFALANAF